MSDFEHYRRDLLPAEPPVLEPAHVTAEPLPPPAEVRRPASIHPNYWFAWLWAIAFTLCQLATLPVVAVAVVIQGVRAGDLPRYLQRLPTDPAAMADVTWPAMIVQFLLMTALVLLLMGLFHRRNWRRAYAWRRPSAAHLALTLLIAPGVMLVGEMFGVIGKWIGLPELMGLDQFMDTVGYWPWWLAVLIIGVGPGVAEELMCRAWLGRGLVAHYGVVPGVLLASLFFGLIHLEPLQVFYAVPIGVLLHFVYLTTRSLWMPMLLHFLNNAVSVLSSAKDRPSLDPRDWFGAADPGRPHLDVLRGFGEATAAAPWMMYAAAAALVLGVGYALYASRARLVPVPGGPDTGWRPACPAVDVPPPDSGYAVRAPFPGWAALLAAYLGVAAFAGALAAALSLPANYRF